jgi:hypothetical protein
MVPSWEEVVEEVENLWKNDRTMLTDWEQLSYLEYREKNVGCPSEKLAISLERDN